MWIKTTQWWDSRGNSWLCIVREVVLGWWILWVSHWEKLWWRKNENIYKILYWFLYPEPG